MADCCPKYLKYLARTENQSNGKESRLEFPSTLKNEDIRYDANKNYCHCEIFPEDRKAVAALTEMKDKYIRPTRSFAERSGIRRYIHESYLLDKRTKEMIAELTPNLPLEASFNTEYSSNYQVFRPRVIKSEFEYAFSHFQHTSPAYGGLSEPVTFYTDNYTNNEINNRLAPFRKSTYFTKPLSERMERGWIL